MNRPPITAAIELIRIALGLANFQTENQDPGLQSPPASSTTITPSPFLPPLDSGDYSVLPPFNPIGEYNPPNGGSGGLPQNPNEIPDDISDLLGGR